MKAVILSGGFGTRLSEETVNKPKTMVKIGGKPIIWHIMKIYSSYGINEFILCLGYKGYMIKDYFVNYFINNSDITVDIKSNCVDVHQSSFEDWKITLVDTGEETMTGGRLKRITKYLDDEDFCFTYGDGVADIDIRKLIQSHQLSGKLATVTAVQPPGRFGALQCSDNIVNSFCEKPPGDGSWINGGFFYSSS